MKKFNAIDLFCGAGGLSLGFQQAGFNIIVGVDNEQAALDTFEFNHKGAIGLNADLSKRETFDLILKTAGDRKIDVVIAGPPCQGFSLTGPRNFDDPRNKLYLAVIEMVKQYNPKGFIIENVPGMANMYKGQVKDEVLKRFRKMGYNIDCRILKACDYGVPQMRKRLVFMGVRKDIGNPHFPDPTFGPETKKPYRTCRDAISDLPTRTNNLGKNEDEYVKPAETEYQVLMRDGCSILYNHIATNHKQFVKDTILFQFKVTPGIDWNGNFDAKRFDYWMKTVKTWSRDNDRYEVAMHTVGSGLSYAELDEDKLPQTAIIEELNRVENEELRRGYYLGIINQRGVHWIDPEGKPELELAEDYENRANIAESRGYSRYADILRVIADEFKREAKRNILEARNGDDE